MIYTLTINPAIDYSVWVDMLVIGDTNRTCDEYMTVGGKGINVSFVLKNLGIDSVTCGFVAGFTGDAVEKAVTEKGIKTDFIHLNQGNTRINVKIKSLSETEINGKGPKVSDADAENLKQKLSSLKSGDWLVLAGSLPGGIAEGFYGEIMAMLEGKGVKCVVDTTGEKLLAALKYKPFLIKPNLSELEEIAGKKLESEEEIFAVAESLKEQGAENVLVSMGGDGAILVDTDGLRHRVEPIKGKLVNSVGAGDSMVAGFIAGYITTNDYEYALKLGNCAGAATAFSKTLATGDEIKALLGNN